MPSAKIAISLDAAMLASLDHLVSEGTYPSRSAAIQNAVAEKLKRLEGNRLARECAKLDPDFEVAMAEEGLSGDATAWPEF